MYAKAKDTSVLIRLPCNLAETVTDKSLKIAFTVAHPLLKPLSELAHVIDDYAVEKLRQIETKYPAINTPTEEFMNTFNEKIEPVRHVMNSVKDTTTSTMQHGKETIFHVATATVHKAPDVADSVFSFCETYVPGIQHLNAGKTTELREHACSTVSSLFNYAFHSGRGLKNVCYDEYGCFTSGPPFGLTLQRPIALLPDPPEVIDTRFLLYTRQSKGKAQAISRHTTLGTWDRTKATKILVHGFLDTINSAWWPEMKDAFLQAEDCNVILTDWSRANYFPYTKATANAQVVGADIALLVNKMIKEHGANPADFHIVAHSLGAAVAGYAGHRISGLGRITGLDPASPFFENTDSIVRLDPSDAEFVDIIHTDGSPTLLLGFG
ncbi:unnamed protein product [Rotaria sordida]|uniref:Lipase domain-containing protein n=1 Tax=Rotaria sordida TaxID=392033 RepID=A0A815D803_9BILA|nr:unnamed protein product [Rotaria sordida]CAF1423542.1 unnamed protein product [Rotaria sordida]